MINERDQPVCSVVPNYDSEATQFHLDATATSCGPDAHAIILLDLAGREASRCCRSHQKLNGQGNIWQFVQQNRLSSRVFTGVSNIVDLCCDIWNRLVDQPWKIMSTAQRQWTVIG